jgi:hypothetical protein
MIDMGSSAVCPGSNCPAVIIEHLWLDGGGGSQTVNGIVNQFSQELSRVNDVYMTNITGLGVGLSISTITANNSGPYSNMTFVGTGICVSIKTVDTRGVHGLNCTTTGSTNSAAVYVDGQRNSIEDVNISGESTQDGILIGSKASGQGSVLFNVTGSGLNNVIEISSNATNNVPNGSDVTIMGVTSSGSIHSIDDDLAGSELSDPSVGLYVLGEKVTGNGGATVGYSRFTTSPTATAGATGANSATWILGSSAPTPASGCVVGSLYSVTTPNSTTNGTLFGCAGGTSGGTWIGIK